MCFAKDLFRFFCVISKNTLNLRKKYFLIRINKFILLFLFLLCSLTIFYIKTSDLNSVMIIDKEEQWNASCYDIEEGNVLELFENIEFPPSLNSIYFIETSCRGGLTSRQACSIEAAARAHPRSIIYVLFTAPVSEIMLKSKISARLLLFYNIKFVRILFRNYAKNTPLNTMIASKPFYKSIWWIEHTSDIIRYLTLYKYGGIYLDTDMLVVKSLEPLGYNWVGRQDDSSVNGAAIALSLDKLGQKVAKALVIALKTSYRYDLFGHNGPEAVTKALQKICITSNVTEWSSETCSGFKVTSVDYFYPIYYTDVHFYFNSSAFPENYKQVYAYHLWNRVSSKMKIEKGSLYMKLAEEYCPSIFQIFNEKFGT